MITSQFGNDLALDDTVLVYEYILNNQVKHKLSKSLYIHSNISEEQTSYKISSLLLICFQPNGIDNNTHDRLKLNTMSSIL